MFLCFFLNGSHIHFGGAMFVFGGVEALKRDGVSEYITIHITDPVCRSLFVFTCFLPEKTHSFATKNMFVCQFFRLHSFHHGNLRGPPQCHPPKK